MTDKIIILAPLQIRRCGLFRCERQAEYLLKGAAICGFHHMLLTHGRGWVNFLNAEKEKQRKDPNFGLTLEDEEELEVPGGKPQ